MAVTFSRDAAGRELAFVPLRNHQTPAVLFREDYEEVIARLGPAAWFANPDGRGNCYVRVWNPKRGNNEMVARVLLDAPPRRQVRPRNRNPFDLRRTNLELVQARGRKRTVVSRSRAERASQAFSVGAST